ncbi:MAG TPA: glycosyltransferase family 2 protein [Chryseolinea sp.]|nr:glycosyltransferase family 2 protein [Chryseolinea sp.]
MINTFFWIFWIALSIVLYTYVGYGVIIYILAKVFPHKSGSKPETTSFEPEVTLIIAAYNEELYIEQKIKNTLALHYPSEKLKIWFVTDGSSDSTPTIIQKFDAVKLFHQPERQGKIHAVNRVMKFVETPFVIFCDANTDLNADAIKNIVRHYNDKEVGGVAGEKRIFKNEEDNASGAGEGMYWKYESFLKRKDAEVYSVVGAAGELFSIRTELFEEPEKDIIIEDFYMSLRITARGFRFMYEPDAYAVETASESVAEEWKRKVRICAGAFQAMIKLRYLLNPFRFGILSFQYISHRVLRWTLAPLSLLLILFSNIFLALYSQPLYTLILLTQIFFYTIAYLGYVYQDKKIAIKGFFVPYYFAVMNLSVYAGLVRFLRGKQSVVWEKSKRAA